MTARLQLLGPPTLFSGGKATPLPATKPSSLLIYLAYRGAWTSRSELAFLYRPDEAEEEALAYLRKLVFRARRLPWAEGFKAHDAQLCWPVQSDVQAFRLAVDEKRWADALGLHGGPLLKGWTLEGAPGFDAWLELERGALEAQWKRAARNHAEDLKRQGGLEDAAEWLERALSIDPFDEDTLQAYLQVLQESDERHRALTAYDTFCRLLKEELDAERTPGDDPSPRREHLSRRRRRRPSPSAAPSDASQPARAHHALYRARARA
jgi:DNA-binding SARP family transcriptional activator